MQNNGFDLSIAAKNVEARFYNKLGIVYVEGEDDLIFWAQYFDPHSFEIRKVDGCKNLEDYEDDILHHGLKCIVAKDADYSSFISTTNKHPLIVCTLSHSIECIMYCPYNVNACLKKLARTFDDHVIEIKQIYDAFFTDAKSIITYDIANSVFGVGCSVCGDSCVPFMESNHSVRLSVDKLNTFIEKVASSFTKEQIKKAKQLIDSDKRELRQITKGHFQTSFVINLLKKMTTQITQNKAPIISKDALFALLITCFAECSQDCEERKIIRQRVTRAVAALRA